MPTRTYQVNYDITANTAGALRQFQELQMPMAEVAKSARAAQESLTMVVETAQRLKSLCNNGFVLKPTINTKSFADALATMEANVKASSMRMRASLEAALSGSSKDHERINNLLGAGNWKKAASEQTHEVEKMERNLKLLRNLNSKYSRGTSANAIAAKKEADAYFSALQSSGVDGMKRAQNLLKSVGLGNILFKDDKGWNFAGGDSKTKLKDYIKNLESQYTEANKSLQKAIAKNKSTFGNIQNQTAFNKKGSFIERMLGVSPEQMKEMAPALNAINSMMGGVQQTQEKIQNIVKKTPIPKPIAPKDLPSNKMMRDLQSQIKAEQNKKLGVWARDNELKSWEMLEKAGKLDKGSKAKKTYETLKKQRKIWASSQLETMASDSEIAAKQSQLAAYQKQRGEYASQLRNWRAKPFTETVEQVKVAATEARKATAQPVNLNIGGNFTKKIQPLINLAKALTSIPKEPVDVAVNVNVNNGAVDALKAIKTNLQGINTARANIARGGFGKIEKLAEITAPKTEKIVGNASVKAVLDRTTLGGDLRNSTNNLTKLSKENFVRMKAVLDRTSLGGDLRTSINNLNRIAREYPIRLRAALDRTSLGGDLRSSIGNLTKLAKERPLKIKAEFDGAALKQSVTKTLNGLKTKKNVPTIKLALDTSEATAALNKLLSSIKAASPQNIKLGATATGQGGRGGSVGSGSRGGVGGGGVPPTSTNRTSYGGNISNIAATGAAMRSGMSSSKPGVVDRLRKSVYPLTGNVSLGASTPVALDMAKGMGVMYGVGGAMNLVTGGLTEAMEYQNTMETAEEILKRNYSGKDFNKDFKDMSAEVRRVAKQTKFTAPQAADATRFMAMAGLSIPMIKASVSPVADVAVIGDNDFGEVADKMTNIQTAFQIAQQKMRHVADALTNTFTKTNTDMMMLAESMQYAAPMAHLSGLSLEDTLAMVGVMGNSGIQASMAGTTLRMMLQNTLNPNKKQAALWKRLGVSTRNGDGSLRNMINILADVKEAQKRSKLTMADVVSNLFRVTASAGAGAVINNIGEVRRLSRGNYAVGNISEEISARKQNTVKGLWAQMTSSFTEANLKVFERFQEDIKGVINAVKSYFDSKEAVENLTQAFDMIRSLMNMLGKIAKAWMWAYNNFGWVFKAAVWTQMFVSQVGLAIKPIMSLVNAFGGLKSMAVGFVSALSGIGAAKKAVTAGAVTSAVTSATSGAAGSSVGGGSVASSAAGSAAYVAQMESLRKKKEFYDTKATRLKNSVQAIGSKTGYRVAINPFWFGTPFPGANKRYQFTRSSYFGHYDFDMQQRHINAATARSTAISGEMAALRAKRLEELKANRRAGQMANIALMERYAARHKGDRMAQLALLSTQMAATNHASAVRKRAVSIYGWGKVKRSFNAGQNLFSMASFGNGFKDLLKSIKFGFLSVISTLAKAAGILLGPVGLVAASFAAVAGGGWLIYKRIQEEKERVAKNNRNSAKIRQQAASLYGNYTKNVAAVENGITTFKQKGRKPLQSYVAPVTLGTSKKAKQYGALEKNFAAINAITSDIQGADKARLIFDQYVKPNFELMGGDGSFARKEVLTMTFNHSLLPNGDSDKRQGGIDVMNAGGFAPGAKLPSQRKVDLSHVKKQAAIAQIYRAGAASKEAMNARKKIFEIYKKAKDLKEAQSKARDLIEELFGATSIQAIGETDANYSSYGEITKSSNLSSFKQYRWGAQNSLLNWINNSNGSKLGYFEGIMKLKEKLTPYTSEWQDAMSKIMSSMQIMFQDANGKIQQVSMTFDKNGTPLWHTLYDQLNKLHVDFGHSFNDHLSVLTEILKQMWNNPELQQYIKQIGGIREWLMKEAMKLKDIQGGMFKDAMKLAENNSWPGQKGYAGEYSHEEYEKYRKQYLDEHGYTSTPLSETVWKKQKMDEAKSPFLQDIKKRKEVADAVDSKLKNDESLKALKKLEDAQNGLNDLGKSGGGGGYTSPISGATSTNKGLGGNRYRGATARPTQINIRIDKLANFDKIQFLEGKDKDIANAIADATAEAVSNLVPMLNALVTNDRRADMI